MYPIMIRFTVLILIDIIFFFFFNDTATTEIYTLSLHDALPISEATFYQAILRVFPELGGPPDAAWLSATAAARSEEHTSELQSRNISYAVFCLKKKKK